MIISYSLYSLLKETINQIGDIMKKLIVLGALSVLLYSAPGYAGSGPSSLGENAGPTAEEAAALAAEEEGWWRDFWADIREKEEARAAAPVPAPRAEEKVARIAADLREIRERVQKDRAEEIAAETGEKAEEIEAELRAVAKEVEADEADVEIARGLVYTPSEKVDSKAERIAAAVKFAAEKAADLDVDAILQKAARKRAAARVPGDQKAAAEKAAKAPTPAAHLPQPDDDFSPY